MSDFNLASALLSDVAPGTEDILPETKPKSKRGGARQGAGRPKGIGKYGCTTKAVRVPGNIAERLPELLSNIGQLEELLREYEVKGEANTARYYFLNKLLADIKALGFLNS